VRETLDRLALESDRVKVIETAITDATALPDVLGQFVAGLEEMGPNPMKGF
jgi:quinone-modifying oxidoreductase subunit QmoB